MVPTIKKLIFASLLLSIALIAAVSAYAAPLYFPHVATSMPWQTEIAIINTSDLTVPGTLRGLSNAGQLIETKAVTLSARGRRQIIISSEFTNHADIGYIIFDTDSSAVQGYTKFYQEGIYRSAIPAVKEVNTSDMHISHIASNTQWWTGISLVNTTSAAKELTITFNNGWSLPYTLNANEHKAFAIESLFNNQPQPDIQSAVIQNASGVIGLELFGSTGGGNQLEGVLLTDDTASTIYYPHVASNNIWWTGIVAYNPSDSAGTMTITPYSAQGTPLSPTTLPIAGKGKYIGVVSALGLPAQTEWFKIDSTQPLTGFELFGTIDNKQLAAYSGSGAKTGVFAKIEKYGWTGIAFVNTEAGAASVTLTAYNDNGSAVATQILSVGGYAKVVDLAETIFSQDISGATYIAYSSDRNVVGFQLNSASDDMMLDGLPGLAGGATTQENAIIIGLVEDSSSPILALATGQDGKEALGFVRNTSSSSTESMMTKALSVSGNLRSSTSSPFDIIYSVNNETVVVSLYADGTPNTFDDTNGLRGVFSNHTDSTANLTIYKDNIIVGGPMQVNINNADIRSSYQNCSTCSVIPTPLDNYQWTAADTWRFSAAVLSGVGCVASIVPIASGVGTLPGIAWATYSCGSFFLSVVIDDKAFQDSLNIIKLPLGATECTFAGVAVISRQYGEALNLAPGCLGSIATVLANTTPTSSTTYDATGTWRYVDTSVTDSCDPVSYETGTATIAQIGNTWTGSDSDGDTMSGTVSGATYTSTKTYPDDGGTSTDRVSFTLNSSTAGTYSNSWTWTDGTHSCSGTNNGTISKVR